MNKIQTFVFILSIFLSIEAIHAQINNNMDKSIIISTSEDLYQLACKVNQGNSFDGVHIKLANDLLLNDTTGWQQWKKGNSRLRPWTPIGNAQSPFRGDFDGQGHTIYGIYMNESSNNQIYQGLFGFLEDGSISHVHIRSSFFIGHNFVGAICGYIKGTYLKGIAQIDHCSNNSSVESSRNHAGGIVGFSEGCNRIINCSNNGMVKAKRCAGGIAGYFQDGTIINCYNRGRIHILYESAGGIIGEYYENPYRGFTESDTIANCYNTGIVSGRDVVGGIIGNLQLYSKEFVPQKIHIDNCYNAGMLKSTYPVTTDGLIGCYTYYQTEQEVFSSLKLNRGSLKKQLKNMIPQIVYGLNPRNSLTTKEDNDLNDPAHIHRGTGTVRRIERYSAKSYWSDLCCSPVNLTQPRFNTYKIAEEYWSELMRYSQHCKQFERCEDASMKAHAFVKRLNKWVKEEEKKLKKKKRQTSLYLEWQTDAEKINEGYPIFIESEKN